MFSLYITQQKKQETAVKQLEEDENQKNKS